VNSNEVLISQSNLSRNHGGQDLDSGTSSRRSRMDRIKEAQPNSTKKLISHNLDKRHKRMISEYSQATILHTEIDQVVSKIEQNKIERITKIPSSAIFFNSAYQKKIEKRYGLPETPRSRLFDKSRLSNQSNHNLLNQSNLQEISLLKDSNPGKTPKFECIGQTSGEVTEFKVPMTSNQDTLENCKQFN
jgi:hypothetical protein